jgi:hypothetical protein
MEAEMAVFGLEIVRSEPFANAMDFGDVGPYERIDAIASYSVDPDHEANAGIVDLELADRDSDGLVRFSGDVVILRPRHIELSNRVALMDVTNRGRCVTNTLFNRAVADVPPTNRIPEGDGFLMRHGFSLAWCGWQWDVPRGPGRLGFEAPVVTATEPGWMQLRLQLTQDAERVPLADHHVGATDAPAPIPTADPHDPDAVLYVRTRFQDEPVVISREQWRFSDAFTLALDGGLRAGLIYDLVYRVGPHPVVGTGLLAVRDFSAFLRSEREDNPLANLVERVVVTGMSQNSRLLRHMLHLGLDVDEAGNPAFDAVLGLVGGARRGEFNHRYAQPSVQPTPNFGHLFPFADTTQTDSRTGNSDGLLDRVASRPRPPKIVFADTSAEYWRGDASLAHTDVETGADVLDAPFVRRYLFAGTQHSVGPLALDNESLLGIHGTNPMNIVDYRPLYRCLLVNLMRWIKDGSEPPASEVPRLGDGTAADRGTIIDVLSSIPTIAAPEAGSLPVLRAYDLGPLASAGVGSYPADPIGRPYPTVVSAVDADGNETGGIRMPDVSVPVATHLGFNPRRPDTGAGDQIVEYYGSTIPFATTAAQRSALDDRRPSIEERYEDLDAYLSEVRRAADLLVTRRHLLAEDVDLCIELARERYLLVTGS